MSTDELLARAKAQVGTILCGKYRLDGALGVGGMAAVFAATHMRNANRVAVKVLHRELLVDAGLRGRFLREGYASNTVEHPCAVRILDDDTAEDGSVFLVMELLEGEPLDVRWEKAGRLLPAPEVAAILWQLLDVLAAAHAKGIVHRDVKPQNLFVTRDGRLKLLDFGVARLRELTPTMTRSGALLGTPAFMAPEQALGRRLEIDALSDVWAAGATAFALVSGRFVHMGETPEEIVVRAATQPAPRLATVAPHVVPALAAVIDRALEYARANRWPSARAMQQALPLAETRPAGVVAPLAGDASRSAPERLETLATTSSFGGLAAQRARSKYPRRGRDVTLLALAAASLVALSAGVTSLLGRGDTGHAKTLSTATGPSGPQASTAPVIPATPAPRSPEMEAPTAAAPPVPEPAASGATPTTALAVDGVTQPPPQPPQQLQPQPRPQPRSPPPIAIPPRAPPARSPSTSSPSPSGSPLAPTPPAGPSRPPTPTPTRRDPLAP